jgi:hypothetical protein
MDNFDLRKYLAEGRLFKESQSLNEVTDNNFNPPTPKELEAQEFLEQLMPRTAQTTDKAMERISDFAGNTMFIHYQYFDVKPHGNSPDRPTYRLHNSQYWLNETQLRLQRRNPEERVNVTLLSITDITDPANEEDLGSIFVNTQVYLDEQPRVFEILNKRS